MRFPTGLMAAAALALSFLTPSCFFPAAAHEYKAGQILVDHPVSRAVTSAQKTAAVYLEFRNSGGADRLVSASTDIAGSVEPHRTENDNGVMVMKHLPVLDIPAGGTVTLSPRTPLHLMLMDLKRQLKEGDKFPLTLTFEKSGSVTVTVLVGKAGAMGPDMDPHANHQR